VACRIFARVTVDRRGVGGKQEEEDEEEGLFKAKQ